MKEKLLDWGSVAHQANEIMLRRGFINKRQL